MNAAAKKSVAACLGNESMAGPVPAMKLWLPPSLAYEIVAAPVLAMKARLLPSWQLKYGWPRLGSKSVAALKAICTAWNFESNIHNDPTSGSKQNDHRLTCERYLDEM